MLVVALILVAVTIFSGKGWIEWIGALAVLLTFAHVQVADRLAEGEASREERAEHWGMTHELLILPEGHEKRPTEDDVKQANDRLYGYVECHWKLKYFLVSKEICWLVYFVVLGAYSALVGVGVFLAYPVWRHQYRKRKPLEAQSSN